MLPKAGPWVTDKGQRGRAIEEFRGWMRRLNETYPPGGLTPLNTRTELSLVSRALAHRAIAHHPRAPTSLLLPGHPLEYMVGSMAHGNDKDKWFNASQISWLVDRNGAVLVDEVIKLEELDQTSLRVGIRSKLSRPPSQNKPASASNPPPAPVSGQAKLCSNLGMGQVNPSSHGHYSEYYDEATRQILESYMWPDIRRYNYVYESQPDA